MQLQKDMLMQNKYNLKKVRVFFILSLFLLLNTRIYAQSSTHIHRSSPKSTFSRLIKSISFPKIKSSNFHLVEQKERIENKKLVSAITGLTLGAFGVHRIYLGTHPAVPAAYTLTIGGGFYLLPLIDTILILSHKDLSKFENNSNFFMWTPQHNAINRDK